MNLPLHRLPFALSLGALLLTACPSDDVPADTTATDTDTGDGDGDGDPGDGDGDPGDGDGDGDGDTGSSCGDGVLDAGEACDDGNTDDGDGCSSTCTVSACGLVWTASEAVPNSTAGSFDVAVGTDGSIYGAGITINADNDAWAVKWNPDGSVAWSQSFDSGNGNDAAVAIALGAGGEVYVAGWMQGADDDDLWYAALDGATGNETWSQLIQGPMMVMEDADDLATGIAVDPTGGIVIVGRSRVATGDDDVWVRKAMADSGEEVWTTTWTGAGDGNFSTDRSGPVAVAADGTIWVTAREHVDFNTQEATLLEFDGSGTLLSTTQPQAGGNQTYDPVDVAVDGDTVYFAFEKTNFPYRGWLYKFEGGTEAWVKTEQDWIDDDEGDDWTIRGLGIDADGNLGVGGVFANEEPGEGIDWGEAWVAKLDGAGDIVCRSAHMVDDGNLIPPSLDIDGAGYGSAGFGLTGIETAGQGNATTLWTGFFMP
ncbi:PQQ-like beta-propeller repeat protein [Enhygromyxa salina]|uniref:Uncharacterized protein n=1 Tax=Enhygromyxa salina TaxID=215803 RepID=A0A2S9Y871_9BACT|nr:hypothetical protein ENSA7_58210 [Enhygromyxa salina]